MFIGQKKLFIVTHRVLRESAGLGLGKKLIDHSASI